ncbi:hydantoinase/oxoprolinase family protein [Azohydromonas caseinilytica]|uniref:H4MPT-linked C1 transfer pathway protein n=1 Tax=Azohydromonas caseinilytica TaxID=2728836 RepID=A0A848FAQ5_9BURK|nr:hydantoinase/oxoprolinase family protein [Azohydromonas caseinilytica]NML15835.1 H4MPT-linked C1 transfer pathway protein [Azohydromonas caseinilytica]
MQPERHVVGWDIGGAHVKAAWVRNGRLQDAVQWACPLWESLDRLDAVLAQARARWPQMRRAQHVVTMTGEMADLFASRAEGVRRIADHMARQPGIGLRFYAGEQGFVAPEDVAAQWEAIASANWLATAQLAARRVGDGVLVDIGSTTCDLIPLRQEQAAARGRTDAQRLMSGELVYQGVVRTPLCALAQRIDFEGRPHNVMNEFFATTADVYRLLGELDPAHDQHPAADHGAKDAEGTRRRLARMVGRDAEEAGAEAWLDFARAWRAEQLNLIGHNLDRVLAAAGVPARAPLVAAGCGSFLVEKLAAARGRPCVHFASQAVPLDPGAGPGALRQAQLCAPAVAVALLLERERH